MPGVTFFPLNDVPFLSLFFNFYGYYLPIFLYATWTSTALFDLVLMDGGKGDSPTNENLGRVILGIAAQIKNREQELLAQADQIGELQTHEERLMEYKDQGLT